MPQFFLKPNGESKMLSKINNTYRMTLQANIITVDEIRELFPIYEYETVVLRARENEIIVDVYFEKGITRDEALKHIDTTKDRLATRTDIDIKFDDAVPF